ncbi:hypothetical protein HELRODRAFT_169858 [Helobdella robusta]|uniref:Uncharacterized protein n=1 Tax=Helobdella robusta TaxID=6412 RepID=T1F2D7_HELRO|nr:hypothetical protein HELRODRAFT_169858 [Helobdella robusta]ESO08123.1 hypothetical protein HELRODRAFT_169858 [Helobdella robusta]
MSSMSNFVTLEATTTTTTEAAATIATTTAITTTAATTTTTTTTTSTPKTFAETVAAFVTTVNDNAVEATSVPTTNTIPSLSSSSECTHIHTSDDNTVATYKKDTDSEDDNSRNNIIANVKVAEVFSGGATNSRASGGKKIETRQDWMAGSPRILDVVKPDVNALVAVGFIVVIFFLFVVATLIHAYMRWLWTGSIVVSTASFQLAHMGGQVWYTICGSIPVILSTILSFRIRFIAPGAKTFLQVIKARLGTTSHIMLISIALLTNFTLATMVLSEAARIASALCTDVNIYIMAAILVLTGCFSSTISGLGGSIYFSYCVCTFVTGSMLVYFHSLTPTSKFYTDFLTAINNCSGSTCDLFTDKLPAEQIGMPRLNSKSILIFAFIRLLSGFSSTVTDQSFWMTAVATRPTSTVKSHILGGFCWFFISITLSYVFGIVTGSMRIDMRPTLFANESTVFHLSSLPDELIAIASQKLLDQLGSFIIFCLVCFLCLACLTPQLLSLSSIIIYDISMTYLKPFEPYAELIQSKATKRKNNNLLDAGFDDDDDSNNNKNDNNNNNINNNNNNNVNSNNNNNNKRSKMNNNNDKKINSDDKNNNNADLDGINLATFESKPKPKKPMARNFGIVGNSEDKMKLLELYLNRQSQDFRTKTFSTIVCSVIVFGLTYLVILWGVESLWLLSLMGIFTSPCIAPVCLTFFWKKANAIGVVLGVSVGLLTSLVVWFTFMFFYPDDWSNFFDKSSYPMGVLSAQCTGILVSSFVSASLGWMCHGRNAEKMASFRKNKLAKVWWYRVQMEESGLSASFYDDYIQDDVWTPTLAIDSPVVSWMYLYSSPDTDQAYDPMRSREFYSDMLKTLNSRYRKVNVISYAVPVLIALCLFFLWPIAMYLLRYVPLQELLMSWRFVIAIFAWVVAVIMVVLPLAAEIWSIYGAVNRYSTWKRSYTNAHDKTKDDEDEDGEVEMKEVRGQDGVEGASTGKSKVDVPVDFRFARQWNFENIPGVNQSEQQSSDMLMIKKMTSNRMADSNKKTQTTKA